MFTQKEIIKNNKLIARFIRWTEQTDPTEKSFGEWFDRKGVRRTFKNKEVLIFHSDWNWLMLAVEEIENLAHILEPENATNVTIGATNYCVIQDNMDLEPEFIGQGRTKIESVYIAVVSYIKWYYKNY